MDRMVVVDRYDRLVLGGMVLGMDVVLVVRMALGMDVVLVVRMALGMDVVLVVRMALGMDVVLVVVDHMGHMGYVVGMMVQLDDDILVRSMDRMGCRSSICC